MRALRRSPAPIVALIAAALVVASCGQLTDAERAAGAAYAGAADTADRGVHDNDAQLDSTLGSEEDFRAYYRRWAAIEHDFIAQVDAIPMPPALEPDADAIVAAYGRVEALLHRLETEPIEGWDTIKRDLDHAIRDAIRAADVLRPKLGLPKAEEAAPS